MGWSKRKPYYDLKSSLSEFFKEQVRYLRESNEIESAFEKPYLDQDYHKMHLNLPWPDWSWPQLPSLPGAFGNVPDEGKTGTFRWGLPQCWLLSQIDCLNMGEQGNVHWKTFGGAPSQGFSVAGTTYESNLLLEPKPFGPHGFFGTILVTALTNDQATKAVCMKLLANAPLIKEVVVTSTGPLPPQSWHTIAIKRAMIGESAKDLTNQFSPTVTEYYPDETIDCGCVEFEVPCTVECSCAGIIAYTTQQMQVDETQDLAVSGYGADASTCYTWAITSGGGSLSEISGFLTTYTAPATNADCAENPTITLYCDGLPVDTLDISINAYTGSTVGYSYHTECWSAAPDWKCRMDWYYCSGVLKAEYTEGLGPTQAFCQADACCGDLFFDCTGCFGAGAVQVGTSYCNHSDRYDPTLASQGCCPAAILL